MGGEPTTNPQLPELLAFCKHELGVTTRLGHTNGSGLVTENLDGSNVSFKAFDDGLHREYTGHPAAPLFENFRRSYEAGIEMRASTVFIPDFGGLEQVAEGGGVRRQRGSEHPVPHPGLHPRAGAPWRRPDRRGNGGSGSVARRYLDTVTFSHFTSEQAKDLTQRDERFAVQQVL